MRSVISLITGRRFVVERFFGQRQLDPVVERRRRRCVLEIGRIGVRRRTQR